MFKNKLTIQEIQNTLTTLEKEKPKGVLELGVFMEKCNIFLNSIIETKKIDNLSTYDLRKIKRDILEKLLTISRKYKHNDELESPFKFYSKIVETLF
jgi:hypothetical protein